MTKLLFICCTPILLFGCSIHDSRELALAAAKRETARLCSATNQGCEFSIQKTKDGWGVHVSPIVHGPDGRRVYIPGANYYGYDNQGKLLRTIPGL